MHNFRTVCFKKSNSWSACLGFPFVARGSCSKDLLSSVWKLKSSQLDKKHKHCLGFLFQVLPAVGTPRSCPARLIGVCARWPVSVHGILLVWLSLWPVLVRKGITTGPKSTRKSTRLARVTKSRMESWSKTMRQLIMTCLTRALTLWWVVTAAWKELLSSEAIGCGTRCEMIEWRALEGKLSCCRWYVGECWIILSIDLCNFCLLHLIIGSSIKGC